jgi:hypothetical protein
VLARKISILAYNSKHAELDGDILSRMNILGIDFTSAPTRRKLITCLRCSLGGQLLRAGELEEWSTFSAFEHAIQRSGPWIAGIDFPFGQARKFIETIGWPMNWREYVLYARSLGRIGFRNALDQYRKSRPYGDKEHRRKTDDVAGSISPQKLHGVPVGMMFFEGAPRLVQAGVTIPGLQEGHPGRVVVEAYPGVMARRIIGRPSYKHDTKNKQTPEQYQARRDILKGLLSGAFDDLHGFAVEAPTSLCDDPTGDRLDALLCAIQAAWAWDNRENNFGVPTTADPLEGWIADPTLIQSSSEGVKQLRGTRSLTPRQIAPQAGARDA